MSPKKPIDRRVFTQQAAAVAAAAAVVGCKSLGSGTESSVLAASSDEFEYIVVGSGAGGGPLAARLALAGKRVLLLEAGGSPKTEGFYNYQIPAFHPFSTEDPEISWNYFVDHYSSNQQRDSKFTPGKGILYPRAGTLGGCTAHHAMFTLYPSNSDWDKIAQATGDQSYGSGGMRRYFERLERCEYLEEGADPDARHGFAGWLPTRQAPADMLLNDFRILNMAKRAAKLAGTPLGLSSLSGGALDPNDWRVTAEGREGAFNPALSVNGRGRSAVKEFVLATQQQVPENLTIRVDALATKILFDENKRARGVEYLEGSRLYRADPNVKAGGTKREVRASKEVILAGGAFNSPQLLMLSGVGPAAKLASLGIPVVKDLPGVGQNLQDRYEVGIVTKLPSDHKLLRECKFDPPDDPCYDDYINAGTGPYVSNGAIIGVMKRSDSSRPDPDLFIFGLPGAFKGYFPGYTKPIKTQKNMMTWAVLKGHTGNRAGVVELKSADPRDTPAVNFKYFDEGTASAMQKDLVGLRAGIKFAREVMRDEAGAEELVPGPAVKTDAQIDEFSKKESWGHHASCTNKMGAANDPMAVVDSQFRVRGVSGVRIVDASVFPEIPGLFIVVPIYMLAEKASDVILAGS